MIPAGSQPSFVLLEAFRAIGRAEGTRHLAGHEAHGFAQLRATGGGVHG